MFTRHEQLFLLLWLVIFTSLAFVYFYSYYLRHKNEEELSKLEKKGRKKGEEL